MLQAGHMMAEMRYTGFCKEVPLSPTRYRRRGKQHRHDCSVSNTAPEYGGYEVPGATNRFPHVLNKLWENRGEHMTWPSPLHASPISAQRFLGPRGEPVRYQFTKSGSDRRIMQVLLDALVP